MTWRAETPCDVIRVPQGLDTLSVLASLFYERELRLPRTEWSTRLPAPSELEKRPLSLLVAWAQPVNTAAVIWPSEPKIFAMIERLGFSIRQFALRPLTQAECALLGVRESHPGRAAWLLSLERYDAVQAWHDLCHGHAEPEDPFALTAVYGLDAIVAPATYEHAQQLLQAFFSLDDEGKR